MVPLDPYSFVLRTKKLLQYITGIRKEDHPKC